MLLPVSLCLCELSGLLACVCCSALGIDFLRKILFTTNCTFHWHNYTSREKSIIFVRFFIHKTTQQQSYKFLFKLYNFVFFESKAYKSAFFTLCERKDKIQQIVWLQKKCNSTKTLDSAALIQFHHKSHWANTYFIIFLQLETLAGFFNVTV